MSTIPQAVTVWTLLEIFVGWLVHLGKCSKLALTVICVLCHTGSVYHHKLAYVTNCMHACGLFAKKHSLSFSRITPRKINEIDKKFQTIKLTECWFYTLKINCLLFKYSLPTAMLVKVLLAILFSQWCHTDVGNFWRVCRYKLLKILQRQSLCSGDLRKLSTNFTEQNSCSQMHKRLLLLNMSNCWFTKSTGAVFMFIYAMCHSLCESSPSWYDQCRTASVGHQPFDQVKWLRLWVRL